MAIQPFSPEQERALINMRQRYDAWIDGERELFGLPYDLRRKKVGGYEYLYEIHDRLGNGTSLGAWDENKQRRTGADCSARIFWWSAPTPWRLTR